MTGSIGQIPADELAVRQAQGYQIDDLVGLSGIEAYYENQLAGQPARTLQIIEPGGIVLRDLGTSSGSPPLPLTLTIDRQLQLAASQALTEAFTVADDNWGAREVSTGAAAVVLDASDGSILALASFPMPTSPTSSTPTRSAAASFPPARASPSWSTTRAARCATAPPRSNIPPAPSTRS